MSQDGRSQFATEGTIAQYGVKSKIDLLYIADKSGQGAEQYDAFACIVY